jgi:hypothetical protein
MFDRYFADSECSEDEPKEFTVAWHNSEFEDLATIEAESEEEAFDIAEEMIGDELPEDAVIDSVKVA